jgi:hypothetical protein
MKTNALYSAVCTALLVGATTLASAQTPTPPVGSTAKHPIDNAKVAMSAEYRAEKDRIEADAKVAKAKCGDLKDNAKDICKAEAKATEKVAMAELENKRHGTPHSQYEVEKTKAETAYDVAKEKCEDKAGADVSACKKSAKADEKAAIAMAKANMKQVSASK